MLVIAACSLTFVAVVSPTRHEPKGPPIGLIAQDLGTTAEHFQQVAEKIVPRRPTGPPPTEAQKKQLAAALDVSIEQLQLGDGKVSAGAAEAALVGSAP